MMSFPTSTTFVMIAWLFITSADAYYLCPNAWSQMALPVEFNAVTNAFGFTDPIPDVTSFSITRMDILFNDNISKKIWPRSYFVQGYYELTGQERIDFNAVGKAEKNTQHNSVLTIEVMVKPGECASNAFQAYQLELYCEDEGTTAGGTVKHRQTAVNVFFTKG